MTRWLSCLLMMLAWTSIALGQAEKAQAEVPLFEDDFESGTLNSWDEVMSPSFPNCNCYFSGDCVGGFFCYWGPGGPATEDICNWRTPKPSGVPGAGCLFDVVAWGPVCDGLCSPSTLGSLYGYEDPQLVVDVIQLWSAAIMEPAIQGGGPVDPDLAAQARSAAFILPDLIDLLGRHVADLMAFGIDELFHENYCHFEHHPLEPGPTIDLSGDTCSQQVGWIMVDVLVAEIREVGSGWSRFNQIKDACPNWMTLFSSRCRSGPDTLQCAYARIQDLAYFIKTPRQQVALKETRSP